MQWRSTLTFWINNGYKSKLEGRLVETSMSYQDLRTGVKGSIKVTICSTVLSCFNVIVHSVGSYLIYSLYKSGSNTVQIVYLINLSISEIVMCLPTDDRRGSSTLYFTFHSHSISTCFWSLVTGWQHKSFIFRILSIGTRYSHASEWLYCMSTLV